METKSAYHMTENMGPFMGDCFYTTNYDFKPSDTVYVISSIGKGAELKAFLEGAFRVDSSTQGEYEFRGKKFGYMSKLTSIKKPETPASLSVIREEMGKRKFAGRYMNVAKPVLDPEEIQQFNQVLTGTSAIPTHAEVVEDDLAQDIDSILQSDTETSRTILARLGQGKFRKNVSEVWKAKSEVCALTGISLPSILTASHIIPWRECVGDNASLRLDGANGILLCSHIDRLFDRHLLSFFKKGNVAQVVYSKTLPPYILQQLSLTSDLELVPNKMSHIDRKKFFECIYQHYSDFLDKEAERKNKWE